MLSIKTDPWFRMDVLSEPIKTMLILAVRDRIECFFSGFIFGLVRK